MSGALGAARTFGARAALDAPDLKPVWISSANCGVTRFAIQHGGLIRALNMNDTRHLIGL